jgi:hypothetical protein
MPFHADERSQARLAGATIEQARNEAALLGHRNQDLEHIGKRLRELQAVAA